MSTANALAFRRSGFTLIRFRGIPVTLGGRLELTFAAEVNPATQLGRTFDLFDWTGVTPTGAFIVSSPYTWDLTSLYTTGEVTLATVAPSLPGDFNRDGTVDAADYAMWRKLFSTDATKYDQWRSNFGSGSSTDTHAAVPELDSIVALVSVLLFLVRHPANRRSLR